MKQRSFMNDTIYTDQPELDEAEFDMKSGTYIPMFIGKVVQRVDYYPSGLSMAGGLSPEEQPYKYNSLEFQTMHGLNWTDMGQRMLDHALARFHVPDRFAEKYYHLSPYSFAAGNAMKYIDVNGDSIWINYGNTDYLYENGSLYTKGGDGNLALYKGNNARLDKSGNVRGYKGLLGTTTNALKNLQSGSVVADKIISTLQSSENSFTIKPSNTTFSRVGVDIGDGRTGGLNNNAYAFQVFNTGELMVDYAPFNQIGSGGVINWNINDGKIGLGHELGHAYDANFGMLDSRSVMINGGYEEIREIRAVYYENKIRQDFGMRLRQNYSGPRLLDSNKSPIYYHTPFFIKPFGF